MHELAKGIIFMGAVLIAVGLLLLLFQKAPFFGKLPGDLLFKRGNFTLYVPLATGIIVSLLISLILYLIGKLR